MPAPVFTRVLVGWDGSAGATRGLQLGCGLTQVPGGRVTALSVTHDLSHVEDRQERAQATEAMRAPLREAFRAALSGVQTAPDQEISIDFVEEDDVASALDGYAATHRIELVIVGLHGREGLLHPRMGHIASRSVRTMRVPVLVVPEPETAPAFLPESRSADQKSTGLFHPFHRRA